MISVEHDIVLPNDIANDIQCLPTINVLTCMVMNDSDHRVNVNSCNDVDDFTLSNYPASSNIIVAAAACDGYHLIDDDGDCNDVGITDESNDEGEGQSSILSVDQLSMNDNVGTNDEIISEQCSDPTLLSCWDMAKAGKGGYVIKNGVLYHNNKVEDQSVSQLCSYV